MLSANQHGEIFHVYYYRANKMLEHDFLPGSGEPFAQTFSQIAREITVENINNLSLHTK